MANEPSEFKRAVVETLAKRAANFCSNPDCGVLTAGPASAPQQAVNVGEAAHIYGGRSGSARYVESMTTGERSEITNGIWLCCTCHKFVDDDPTRFPAGLLFEWRRMHEQHIAEQVGKAGALARERYIVRHLAELGPLSYMAQQIIIDKPLYWEHKLTIELLRSIVGPVIKRWKALEAGLYTKQLVRVNDDEALHWITDRFHEASQLVAPAKNLITDEIQTAWGPPGQPGSEAEIVRVCRLLAEACEAMLDWEERVRFAHLPDDLEEIQKIIVGSVGTQMAKLGQIGVYMEGILSVEHPTGTHKLEIVFDLPEDFSARIDREMERWREFTSEGSGVMTDPRTLNARRWPAGIAAGSFNGAAMWLNPHHLIPAYSFHHRMVSAKAAIRLTSTAKPTHAPHRAHDSSDRFCQRCSRSLRRKANRSRLRA